MTDWHEVEREYGYVPYYEQNPDFPNDHRQTRAINSGFPCPECCARPMYTTLNHVTLSKLDLSEHYIIVYQCARCRHRTAAPVSFHQTFDDVVHGPSRSLADEVQAADDQARDIINSHVIRKMATGPDLDAIHTEPYTTNKLVEIDLSFMELAEWEAATHEAHDAERRLDEARKKLSDVENRMMLHAKKVKE